MDDIFTDREFVVCTADGASKTNYAVLSDMLQRVRETFHMDVAFVSEFTEGHRVFRCVNSAPGENLVAEGCSSPLEESYCQRIVDGRLPMAIPDAMALPAARALPATEAARVGAHLSVPIVLRNGEVFGTLCCFGHAAQPDLNAEDAELLRAVADLVAAGIDKKGLFRSTLWPTRAPSYLGASSENPATRL